MNMRRGHLSFLLRLWQADSNHAETWRASLEDPSTGERKGFADVDALVGYLRSLVAETMPAEAEQNIESLIRSLRSETGSLNG